jgi:CsoR family transcriptional regulator, copper-sensing transcriptional repressor
MPGKCSHCDTRTAHHSEETKSAIDKRMARIEGQLRAVRKMVNGDIYCDEVLNQVTSIMAALNGIRLLLLEKHVKSCVKEQLEEGRLEVVDELMKTISRMTKQ